MNIFDGLDLITGNSNDYQNKLKLAPELLLEIMPEIYESVKQYISEQSNNGFKKDCLYIDNNSYVLKESSESKIIRINFIYIKSIEIKKKSETFVKEHLKYLYLNHTVLNVYFRELYKNEDKSLVCFSLDIDYYITLKTKEWEFYNNWDILNWLMGYWKDYINGKIPELEKNDLNIGNVFQSDLKEFFLAEKLNIPKAEEVTIDYQIKRAWS